MHIHMYVCEYISGRFHNGGVPWHYFNSSYLFLDISLYPAIPFCSPFTPSCSIIAISSLYHWMIFPLTESPPHDALMLFLHLWLFQKSIIMWWFKGSHSKWQRTCRLSQARHGLSHSENCFKLCQCTSSLKFIFLIAE